MFFSQSVEFILARWEQDSSRVFSPGVYSRFLSFHHSLMRFGNSWFIAEILSMPNKPDKIRVSLICGAIIGAVWAIPGLNLINCCCCAGVILGGVLAVYLYKQEFTEEMQPMESSDAVILGIM